jgi:pimeloyl-ACP methyl ester carboxylesterase
MLKMGIVQASLTRRQSFLTLMLGATLVCSRTNAQKIRHGSDADRKTPAWLTLPPTPSLPTASRQGIARVNGTAIFFAQFGEGPPVLLLHGGLANSNYWSNQIEELSRHFFVTVMDTRGHGRSPVTSGTFSYEIFARDVISLLDFLKISTTALVGWSDGAITGIQLALTSPDRLSALFAFGANATPDGLKAGGAKVGAFAAFIARCRREYLTLSPHPERWPELQKGLSSMWRTQPNFSKGKLGTISLPVTIADGEYDEIIKLEQTKQMASYLTKASLLILPNVSHFAMLQDALGFNKALNDFLRGH